MDSKLFAQGIVKISERSFDCWSAAVYSSGDYSLAAGMASSRNPLYPNVHRRTDYDEKVTGSPEKKAERKRRTGRAERSNCPQRYHVSGGFHCGRAELSVWMDCAAHVGFLCSGNRFSHRLRFVCRSFAGERLAFTDSRSLGKPESY